MLSFLTTKPGWQTTEFWIAFVPMVLIVLTMLGVDVTAEDVSGWIYAAAGIVSAGYALGRSIVKAFRASNPSTVVVSKNSRRATMRGVPAGAQSVVMTDGPVVNPATETQKRITTDV